MTTERAARESVSPKIGCVGMAMLMENGLLTDSMAISLTTGKVRIIVHFPKNKKMKYGLTPNYCPSCGVPFRNNEPLHEGEPGCGELQE